MHLRAATPRCTALGMMHFLMHSTIAYTLPIETVDALSSSTIAIGSAAAVLAAAGLTTSM